MLSSASENGKRLFNKKNVNELERIVEREFQTIEFK